MEHEKGKNQSMDSLLRTKLFIPTPRVNLIPRQRLIDLLQSDLQQNGAFTRKLTLIAAPAGYGKTTLAYQWLKAMEFPTAWLTLEPNENEPILFLTYVVIAIQTVLPEIGQAVLGMLQTPQSPPVEIILNALINELLTGEETIILVLDEYHVIQSQSIHEILKTLIEHLPENIHLVIISREDPPLALHRLQARRQILEIRQTLLSFQEDEARAFIRAISKVDLSPEHVTALTRHTEGWVTGLQLATLSMNSTPDREAFISSFTGSDRYILDYLIEEVLNQQPGEIRDFLLRTSMLDRMSGPLCDAVCSTPADQRSDRETRSSPPGKDGQAVLESLEKGNLFIVPLDNERRWYRYHRLFADLLRVRLKAEHPDLAPALHLHAAAWFAGNGYFTPAINHYLKAADFQAVAQLIEDRYHELIMRGGYVNLRGWIEALPRDMVSSRPRLSLAHALSLLNETNADILDAPLLDAAQALESQPGGLQNESRTLLGEVMALRSSQAFYRDDLEGAIELAQQALSLLSADEKLVRGFAALNYANSLAVSGSVEEATTAYEDIVAESTQSGNLSAALIAFAYQAELQVVHGDLHQAVHTHQRALQLATSADGVVNPMGGIALVGLGMIHYERNELDEALICLEQGTELSQQAGILVMATHGLTTLALISHARGDSEGARFLLAESKRMTPVTRQEGDFPRARSAMVRLAYLVGEFETVERWVQQSGVRVDDEISSRYAAVYPYISLARLLIARGIEDPSGTRLQEAVDLLVRLSEHAARSGRASQSIEILTLQARALEAQGRSNEALTALRQALQLAEPEGYFRTFLDEGTPMENLLKRQQFSAEIAAGSGGQKILTYINRLHAAFVDSRMRSSSVAELPDLVEQLSEHELRVLRLVATGLSNREVAEELYVSVNTIKWHLRNTFGKLSVRGRVAAIARAKELRLL
jgi:LuxR family maltose regulon positive regulatory protein